MTEATGSYKQLRLLCGVCRSENVKVLWGNVKTTHARHIGTQYEVRCRDCGRDTTATKAYAWPDDDVGS